MQRTLTAAALCCTAIGAASAAKCLQQIGKDRQPICDTACELVHLIVAQLRVRSWAT